MPIFDQYEVEPMSTYSGSYTDNIIIRNPMLANNVNSNSLGLQIGSAISGLENTFEYVKLTYNNRLDFISGSQKPDKAKNLLVQLNSQNEFIFDSLPPSPASIANRNGYVTPFLTFTYENQKFDSSLPSGSISSNPAQSSYALNTFYAGDVAGNLKINFPTNSNINVNNFIDKNWSSSPYPFRSTYKNLIRISSQNSINFPETINVTSTPVSGSSLGASSFNSREIGSLFIALGTPDESYNDQKPIAKWSQIFVITSSKNQTTLDYINGDNNIPVKSWNNLNYVNGFPNSIGSNFLAVGDYSTVLFSANGYNWSTIASCRESGQNTFPGGIQYDGTTDLITETINTCIPIYKQLLIGGAVSFRRWLLGGEFGILKSTTSTSPYVTKTSWQSVGGTFSPPTPNIYEFAHDNIGGSFISNTNVVAVGGDSNPAIRIFVSNDGGENWTSGLAGGYPGSPLSPQGTARAVAYSKQITDFIMVGSDTSPNYGRIWRSTNGLGSAWEDIATTATFTGTLTSIAIENLAGSPVSPSNRRAVVVGDNGQIYYSQNIDAAAGSVTWTQRTPANSYSGTFKCVRRIYAPLKINGVQISWIAVGEDGEIQYSLDLNANTWTRIAESANDGPAVAKIPYLNSCYMGQVPDYPLTDDQEVCFVGSSISSSIERFPNGTNYNSLLLCKVSDAENHNFVSVGNSLIDNKDALIFTDTNSFLRPQLGDTYQDRSFYRSSIPTFIKSSNTELYKTFYGFGDGIDLDLSEISHGEKYKNIGKANGLVSFRDISYYTMYKNRVLNSSGIATPYAYEIAQIRLHGPVLRGWRYGLFSGLISSSKLYFRRGKFGQFRDMLEQRPFTQFLNRGASISNKLFPVDITFITGSEIYSQAKDYVSATNPSYNPYDSGIYDYHYRSGQPFTDR